MSSSNFLYSLFFLSTLIYVTIAQNGITLPIRNDPKTSQFYTTFHMGSNRAPVNTVIDLGAQTLWFSCNNYTSGTYAPIACESRKCELSKGIGCFGCNRPARPGCSNDTCGASPFNPFQRSLVSQGYFEDSLSSSGDSRAAVIPQFIFSCMPSDHLEGLAGGTIGMLGLARSQISLHKQVSDKLNVPDKFSICLPSSGLGKLSIGNGPALKSNIVTKSTALIINPVSTAPAYTVGDPSDEYFLDIKSIRVAGETLSVRQSYFAIDKNGVGGTKISTIQNYTSLHNSIYKPLVRAFNKAAANMKIRSVAAVGPFRACYSTESISRTRAGPKVPEIDLVLPGKDVYWRISGANSMVEIDRKTMCLGFVDGGSRPRTSIVIGVHQLEENFLEFDLVNSQLKFSSSLLVQNRSCSIL